MCRHTVTKSASQASLANKNVTEETDIGRGDLDVSLDFAFKLMEEKRIEELRKMIDLAGIPQLQANLEAAVSGCRGELQPFEHSHASCSPPVYVQVRCSSLMNYGPTTTNL